MIRSIRRSRRACYDRSAGTWRASGRCAFRSLASAGLWLTPGWRGRDSLAQQYVAVSSVLAAMVGRLLAAPLLAVGVAPFHSLIQPLPGPVRAELKRTAWHPGCPVP